MTPPINTYTQLQLQAIANVSYDACFKSSRFLVTINICTLTFAAISPKLEIAGQALTYALPASNPVTAITYGLGANAPSIFSVSGSNLIIGATATAGTYNFDVTATDNLCSNTKTLSASVILYDCRPTGFVLSPASVAAELNSLA